MRELSLAVFLASAQSTDPGTAGEISAQASAELSRDPGALAEASARSAAASLADAATTASQGLSKLVSKPAPGVLLLMVLLALALIALAAAAAYIFRLRRRMKRAAVPEVPRLSAEQSIRSLKVGKLHEQGRREYQQDAFGISHESLRKDHGLLVVLADGMGGLKDSERVSVTAVETILDRFSLVQGQVDPWYLLLQLAADAHREVGRVLGAADLGRSGSTLVMALIRDDRLYYLAVGDSRICLLRDGALLQLTREHIYENELALRAINGQGEVREVFTDPQRGGLTSFLGMERLSAVDLPAAPVALRPGDKVILMTDGVYNALEEQELTEQLMREPEDAVYGLRAAIESHDYPDQDNYTAVILECSSDEPPDRSEVR